jgi:hypothetical protein
VSLKAKIKYAEPKNVIGPPNPVCVEHKDLTKRKKGVEAIDKGTVVLTHLEHKPIRQE